MEKPPTAPSADRKPATDKDRHFQNHCDNLEKTVKEYKRQLSIATEQLKTANIARNNFLSHMSHELRTPLNAILGFSRLMKDDSNLTEKQVENLGLIHQSGELLLNLINNVLGIAKIDAGLESLNAKTIDLPQFIKGIAEMFNSRAAGHGLTFALDMPPEIPRYTKCDELKLQQILINLMDNSLKFTDIGSIGLKVWSQTATPDQQTDGRNKGPNSVKLYFEISDTGRGIDPEILEIIFDPFFTGSKKDAIKTGPGLGLTISRNLVQIMGGDITAANRLDKGTKFTFHITVELAPEPEYTDQYRVTGIGSAKTGHRILVVDDDGASRFLLSEILNDVGFKVKEAENGKKAVALFFEWRPHLIFMDIRMPLMDGMVATKIIKATREGKHIPVIALTAHAIDEKRRNILAAGCDGYIRKPFAEKQLFKTIAEHLDLAYILKKSTKEPSQKPHQDPQETVEALIQLPTSVLEELKQFSLELNLDHINNCLEQIRTENAPLGESLERVARRFRFNELFKLADQALQKIK